MSNRADRIEDSYKPLGALLGMQPRAEFGDRAYLLFGIAIASLVEGIGLRHEILPELELDKPLVDTPEQTVETLLVGLCVDALMPAFFEPIESAPHPEAP